MVLVFEKDELFNDTDKEFLRREITHRTSDGLPAGSHLPGLLGWDQPKTLYYMVVLCSLAAAVQGMDQSKTFILCLSYLILTVHRRCYQWCQSVLS